MKSADVTFESVRQAAAKLTAEGRPVTVRNVRAALGAGSIYTISMHVHRIMSGGI